MRWLWRTLRFLWDHRSDLDIAISHSPALIALVVSGGIIASVVGAIHNLPAYLWIPLGLLSIIFLELIIVLALTIKQLIIQLTGSPLLILFDLKNHNRKFWSLEPLRDQTGKQTPGSYWEYRAIVKNSSDRTVRNVKVLVETMGPLATRPQQSVFDIDRKAVRDLAPDEEALAVIRTWYHPPIVQGMVCGDDMYGPIKMIAYGDNIQPKTKLFHFNPEKTPMIWEFSGAEEQEVEQPRDHALRWGISGRGSGANARLGG
jgi:hypothetical protein